APFEPDLAAEVQAMRVQVQVARRNLVGAAALAGEGDGNDPKLQAALRELSRTIESELEIDGDTRIAPLSGFDLDQDGRDDLIVHGHGDDRISIIGSSAALPHVAKLSLSDGRSGTAIAAADIEVEALGPGMLGARQGRQWSLHAVAINRGHAESELLTRLDLGEARPTRAVLADLDQDGRAEAYLRLIEGRRLLATAPDAGGRWRSYDPHPATTAAESVVHDLAAGDLDGDGRPELAVAVGEWSAYDARILGIPKTPPSASSASPLTLLARHKLGTVEAVTLLPAAEDPARSWIAVSVGDSYPSRRVFPADHPGGEPGTHVFAWREGKLETVAHLDQPHGERLLSGDFDGDGRHDLALGVQVDGRFSCIVSLQIEPGHFRELDLLDCWP
ncbi:MAG: VCBS repeat-containing protein, partial [Myxococcales bacterium]|nr:VCBS repeat-containing protein [Myxococcales bacterium]